jgi:hypothetical protein
MDQIFNTQPTLMNYTDWANLDPSLTPVQQKQHNCPSTGLSIPSSKNVPTIT